MMLIMSLLNIKDSTILIRHVASFNFYSQDNMK